MTIKTLPLPSPGGTIAKQVIAAGDTLECQLLVPASNGGLALQTLMLNLDVGQIDQMTLQPTLDPAFEELAPSLPIAPFTEFPITEQWSVQYNAAGYVGVALSLQSAGGCTVDLWWNQTPAGPAPAGSLTVNGFPSTVVGPPGPPGPVGAPGQGPYLFSAQYEPPAVNPSFGFLANGGAYALPLSMTGYGFPGPNTPTTNAKIVVNVTNSSLAADAKLILFKNGVATGLVADIPAGGPFPQQVTFVAPESFGPGDSLDLQLFTQEVALKSIQFAAQVTLS